MDAQRCSDAVQGVEGDLGGVVGTEPVNGREMKASPASQLRLAHTGLLKKLP